MTPAFRTRLLLGAPGLALAAVASVIALGSPDASRLPSAVLAGVTVVILWSVAVAIRLRYPERNLGALLFVLSGLVALNTLTASHDPYLFTLARVARPATEVVLVWVMLAFPTGRLTSPRERALVTVAAFAVLLLWLPGVMFSAHIPMGGPLVACVPDCPRNVLLIADDPELGRLLSLAFRAVGALVLVGTAAILLDRLRKATPVMRRALSPVLFASIARTLTIAAFLASGGFAIGLQLALTVTLWAVPLAIAFGLLRGRLYVARALQQLVTGLRARPGMRDLRDVMASALGDPALAIAYWIKDAERWVDADGVAVALPYPSPERGRAVTIVRDAGGLPVAALVHDEALLDEPTLVEAVASSTLVVLESHRMEAELGTSRASAASAVEEERHRIERDLHDGAQQRLIALRMKLGVTARLLENDPARAATLVGELGGDVDAAIAELRAFAHGIAPPVLVERGLPAALEEAALRAPIPVHTHLEALGRCDPALERAVYFCCLEAIQNAAKHGGSGASATITLGCRDGTLEFSVANKGGSDAPGGQGDPGQGLTNMRERIRAVGGEIRFESFAGGYRVSGRTNIRPRGAATG